MERVMSRKIEDKLDKMTEVNIRQDITLAKIAVILESQEKNLEEHMRRTEAAEKGVETNQRRLLTIENTLTAHLSFVKGAVYIIGILVSVITLLDKLDLF